MRCFLVLLLCGCVALGLSGGRLNSTSDVSYNEVSRSPKFGLLISGNLGVQMARVKVSRQIGLVILYYKAKSLPVCICLFVCLFSLSVKRLTNRLTQTRKIGSDCRVNFSWSSDHILTSYVL